MLRHGSRPTAADGSAGVTTPGWGPPSAPLGGLIAHSGLAIGQTHHFQIFYGDSAFGACVSNQNTSQGVSVTVRP